MSREQLYVRKSRRAQVFKQKIVLMILAFALVLICSGIFGGLLTSAHDNRSEDPVTYTYYKSIEIQAGDTLWSIAESYMPANSSVDDIRKYVDELIAMNTLTSEDIHANQYLTVSYYDTEFVD